MQKRILIVINLCFIIILSFVIIRYYPIIKNDDFDQNTQYILLLTDLQIENEKQSKLHEGLQVKDDIQNNLSANDIINDQPTVSFLINGLSVDNELTDQIIKDFPEEISLGFSLYGKSLQNLIEKAKHHQVFLNLPITTVNNISLALDPSLKNEENLRRLTMILSEGTDNVIGYYTDVEQSLSFNEVVINEIINQLRKKEKILCYSSIDKIAKLKALENHIGLVSPDIIIKYSYDKDIISDKLESINLLHKFQSNVLVLIQPSNITIGVLSDFLKQKHNFKIVKITEMDRSFE